MIKALRIVRIIVLALSFLALLGATIFVAVRWPSIPEQVPAHFDGAGQITSYSGKSSLISMLAIAWICCILMAVLARNPSLWNRSRGPFRFRVSGLRLGGKNLIPATGLMLDLLTLVLALMFSYPAVCIALCRGLGAWFLPAVLVGCFAPLLIPLVASLRK